MNVVSKPQGVSKKPLSPEDEKRAVVGFLRLADWPDEKIALVVETHKRGEVFEATIRI